MEFHGKLNLLKTGMVFADEIATVSPRYAQEIQTSALGCGLEGVLQYRKDSLTGILNGIDEAEWNPASDRHLEKKYDVTTVGKGKAACKAALQKELGWPQTATAPLVVTVGRLDDQKGFDLIAEVIQRWVPTSDVQWAILGTGQPKYHKLFEGLAQRYPQKVAVRLEFSNPLAHRFEGGLNQMYSLKYGTVPIVRETGGLADTIVGYGSIQAESLPANGFSFQEYSPLALSETLRRACDLFRVQSDVWQTLIDTGMRQDWTWARSAKKYLELYLKTVTAKG
jgi:starch synthase